MYGRDTAVSTSFDRPRMSSFLNPLTLTARGERRTLASDAIFVPPEFDPLLHYIQLGQNQPKRRRRKGLVKPRKTFFVHVRFNKIVAHMTYVGRPFSFKGLTITLGMSEYNHLEGNWRGLFKKYRNGAIGSIIKSIATHEGRPYDPNTAILGEGSREEKHSSMSIFKKGKNLFRRKERSPLPSDEEDEELNVDIIDEKAEEVGRTLLLGKK